MDVDYNNFAKTFSISRNKLKWEEIDYFLDKILKNNKKIDILDVACWNWRLVWEILSKKIKLWDYLWIDLSIWLLNEAREKYRLFNFLELNMLDLDKINKKYDIIFYIASFHHLDNYENRLSVLKKAYDLLKKWWMIFMTNWALNSSLNYDKYKKSIINWSINKFWSIDYNIKIGRFTRYYHCFTLEELNNLFLNSNFKILENRLFENNKNFVSILTK